MDDQNKRDTQVISAPRGADPEWQEKIERAIKAREEAAATRKGKTASFRASSRLLTGKKE